MFVAEGGKVVERLLESDLSVLSALLPTEAFEPLRPRLEERAEMIDVYVGPKPLLETMTGFVLYPGILGCARMPPPV